MSTQSEDAILNVKINGQDAISTFAQLNQARKDQIALVKTLNENTPEYDVQAQKLQVLNTQYAAWKQQIYGVTEASSNLASELKDGLAGALETLGFSLGVATLVSFGKELISLEGTASGVEQAFAKLGNTDGMIEKLRTSSRGLISDLDLEQLAIKANNANIPLDKMSTLLAFATQRARDTGESVDELTTKLIEGIGKNSPRALSGLGISVQEVKDDFKQTGDMVTTVTNIISRQMAQNGQDVDTFGDKVGTMATKWENIKKSLAAGLQSVLAPELADPEIVQQKTDQSMKAYEGYQKFTDAQLKDAIAKQAQWTALNKKANDSAQAAYNAIDKNAGFFGKIANTVSSKMGEARATAKSEAEDYQAARSVLDALEKEQEKRTAKTEHGQKTPDQIAKEQEEAQKKREQFAEQSKSLTEMYMEFNANELQSTLDANDKEILSTEEKYNVMIQKEQDFIAKSKTNKFANQAELDKHQQEIDNLQIQKADALNQVQLKQAQDLGNKLLALKQEYDKKTQRTQADKEHTDINNQANNLVDGLAPDDITGFDVIQQAADKANADVDIAEKQRAADAKKKIDEDYATFSTDKDAVEIVNINKKYDDELLALKDSYSKKFQATKEYQAMVDAINKNRQAALQLQQEKQDKQIKEAAISVAQDASNAAFSIAQQSRNADLDAETTKLEQQRQTELDNVNLTASQKVVINDKYDKLEAAAKLKKWEADQKAAIEQALINGALAAVKLWVDPGFPEAIPMAITLAGATAANIAVIASQKAPQYEDGGFLPVGASHAAGGLNVRDPLGNLVANIEGGEPIISRKTAAANPNLVNALLGSGGKVLNYEKVIAAANSSKTATPVYSGPRTAGNNSYSTTTSAQTTASAHMDRMEAMMNRTMQMIMATDRKPVVLSNRVVDDNNTKLVQIRDSVNG